MSQVITQLNIASSTAVPSQKKQHNVENELKGPNNLNNLSGNQPRGQGAGDMDTD